MAGQDQGVDRRESKSGDEQKCADCYTMSADCVLLLELNRLVRKRGGNLANEAFMDDVNGGGALLDVVEAEKKAERKAEERSRQKAEAKAKEKGGEEGGGGGTNGADKAVGAKKVGARD
jgi:hypothetical protein